MGDIERWRILSVDEVRSRQFSSSRSFENVRFDLNIYAPSSAGDVAEFSNWGILKSGIEIKVLHQRGFKGEGVRIGVVDTGIDYGHPVFSTLRNARRLMDFESFDEDGRPIAISDPSDPRAAVSGKVSSFGDYHGTHVTGILVGDQLSEKWAGFAPEAELVAARITNSTLSFKAAFRFLVGKGCDIISLSLGQPGKTEAWAAEMIDLLQEGSVIFAASGNEYIYEDVPNRSPANYPLGGLVSVGAIDEQGEVWFKSGGGNVTWPETFTNAYGEAVPSILSSVSEYIVPHLVAPGVDIVSAAPGEAAYSSSGTSMATPHIAGTTAVVLSTMRSVNSDASPLQAQNLLLESLSDGGPLGHDVRFGMGILDLRKLNRSLDSYIEIHGTST